MKKKKKKKKFTMVSVIKIITIKLVIILGTLQPDFTSQDDKNRFYG